MPTYIDGVISVRLWTQWHVLTAGCLLSRPRASHTQVCVASKISTIEIQSKLKGWFLQLIGSSIFPVRRRIMSPHFSQALQRKWCEGHMVSLGRSGSILPATEKVLSSLIPPLQGILAPPLFYCQTGVCVYCLLRAVLLLLSWISSAEEQMTTPDGASQVGELAFQLW